MFKFKGLCAVAALAAAPLTLAEELSDTGEFIDGVAAIVNDGIVLKSQFFEELDNIRVQAAEQGFPLPPENVLREQIMERVVLIEIQLQRADLIGLEISDEILNGILSDLAAQRGITLAELPAVIEAEGGDYAAFRRQIRRDVTLEQLKRIDLGRTIYVSPSEIDQCIADLETNVVVNSEYNLSHILLQVPAAAAQSEIDEILATAEEIVARARDGADFRQLAVRYSESSTAFEGGALGWLEGERVPTIFTDVLGPLGAGDVSDPFRTATSVHIVKVNDMRSAVERSEINQVLVRHILIRPDEIIDDQTAEQQLRDAYNRINEGEEFGELAKLLSDDPGSANDGGELGWAGPGTFVPEFEAIVGELEIGELSEPFRSQFGWHIAELLDTRVYDNTEELKQQNCITRIRASKFEEETLLWLQRLRDEAYVELRM
ncbi:MAG: peptidylprolyl isomerase [Woeseiaceae bacterium]|nr:peptidylprolyl isomerase [Woeseiaceae bacterium]